MASGQTLIQRRKTTYDQEYEQDCLVEINTPFGSRSVNGLLPLAPRALGVGKGPSSEARRVEDQSH